MARVGMPVRGSSALVPGLALCVEVDAAGVAVAAAGVVEVGVAAAGALARCFFVACLVVFFGAAGAVSGS